MEKEGSCRNETGGSGGWFLIKAFRFVPDQIKQGSIGDGNITARKDDHGVLAAGGNEGDLITPDDHCRRKVDITGKNARFAQFISIFADDFSCVATVSDELPALDLFFSPLCDDAFYKIRLFHVVKKSDTACYETVRRDFGV